ncbi:MAG: acyl-CoA thioesterase [Lentimicrobiaceae bacterium]|jgi:acyl-CoA thioester hydrolase|nr:acyl-CoA thioesterase [Lentimicrobiaceae bacterium]
MISDIFSIAFKVRDYECDMQGIVNNTNFLHYLEHARHEYLKSVGLDFAELTKKGVFLVVRRTEIDYLLPLRSNDTFYVTCELFRISPLRFGFKQEIFRKVDDRKVASAHVFGTSINKDGKPFLAKEIDNLFAKE